MDVREKLLRGVTAALIVGLIMSGLVAGARPTVAAADDPAGKLLLLLDSSGSMKEKIGGGRTKITAARSALTKIVRALPARAEVGLRVYGATVFDRADEGACTDTQLVVPIGVGTRDRLEAAIAKYKPYGETPIGYSLERAAEDLGREGRRTIVLVSDGEETCLPDPCPVAAKLAAAGVELKIDVIGFRVTGKARKQLRCIADRGNGDYHDAEDAEDLERSLSGLTTRAFRPFRFSGRAITGADRPAAAPRLAPGTWLDRMPGGDSTRFYRLHRTRPGSTFWIGASLLAPPGLLSRLSLRLYAPDDLDSACAKAVPNLTNWTGGRRLLSGFVVSSSGDEECTRSPELLLEVGAGGLSPGVDGDPVELRVGEEPPLVDRSALPPVAGEPTWRPVKPGRPAPAIGGTSFADAPTLRPGSHAADIAPGELQTYRIHAGWGQRIQVQATTGRLSRADRALVGLGRHVQLELLSPYGGTAQTFGLRGAPALSSTPIGADGSTVVAASKELRWLNREGAQDADRGTALAGDYYLTVRLDGKDGDAPFAVPLTLTVGLVGTAQDPPPYQAATPPTPTPTSAPTSAPPPSSAPITPGPAVASSPNPPWALIIGAIVGVLVLLGGAAVVLGLRRRH
ncbi:vWA domain-containing protein [Microlunatus speluncae]|uniref:vWA domain-containing protein n=1 Tax=Microlunatus speluncae TaxID=2594267 RepID=UPI00126668C6|nr:VWA domain-containing protein [Microlunatus speluncae]